MGHSKECDKKVHTICQSRLPALMTSPAQMWFKTTIDSSHVLILSYYQQDYKRGAIVFTNKPTNF